MVGQVDTGHVGARDAGIDDLRAPSPVDHSVGGGQWSVCVAGRDHVDARHVPGQLHILASSAGGVSSRMRKHDDDVDALLSQPVHQTLDDRVLGCWIPETQGRRGGSVERSDPPQEAEVAHPYPV